MTGYSTRRINGVATKMGMVAMQKEVHISEGPHVTDGSHRLTHLKDREASARLE